MSRTLYSKVFKWLDRDREMAAKEERHQMEPQWLKRERELIDVNGC
jgi:hypothetical protein